MTTLTVWDEIRQLLNELAIAESAVKRADHDYSVCLLTDSLCRDEMKRLKKAREQRARLERELEKARRRAGKEKRG